MAIPEEDDESHSFESDRDQDFENDQEEIKDLREDYKNDWEPTLPTNLITIGSH